MDPSTAKQPRHSFARELFRFNNASSSSPAPQAAIQRIGSADGGPASPYGVIQNRSGNAIPMRKAKTHTSSFSIDNSSASTSSSGSKNSKRKSQEPSTDKRASRLSAILSPKMWSSNQSARSEAKSQPASAPMQKNASVTAATSPPPSTTIPTAAAAHVSPPATPFMSDNRDARVQYVVPVNGSEVIELPVGTRIGKTARAHFKQHIPVDRVPHLPSTLTQSKFRHATSPASFPGSPAQQQQPSPAAPAQSPLPLPPGQKARTVLIGISPPPTAAADGSLATFEHIRKHVLRENEEAILHTVLPESSARRKVTSPQDLIELTVELEREDEQFLEMQSACMNFLTLLAVELETSQRFVKIHVTQAQPPDGGTAAQARAHSRSHSRSQSRTRSRPSSSAGAKNMGRTTSLGGMLAFGNSSGNADNERGRSRVCEALKAREDEAIANELERVAREYKVDLIAIGQPAVAHEEAEDGDQHRNQPQNRQLSRSRSRPHSRTASRAPSLSGLKQQVVDDGEATFDPSRRGSRASKGSASGSIGRPGRRGSAIGEGSILLTGSDRKPSISQLGTSQSPSVLSPDFSRSHSGYSSFSGGSDVNSPFPHQPTSTLSSKWDFGVDSTNAVLPPGPPASAPPFGGTNGTVHHHGYDATQSPRTPARTTLYEEEASSPPQEFLRDDSEAQQVSTRIGQGVHVHTPSRPYDRYSSVGEDGPLSSLSHPAHALHQPDAGVSGPSTGPGSGAGCLVGIARRGSHITIVDEPADSPLRQRERARHQQGREKGTLEMNGSSPFAEGPGSSTVADLGKAPTSDPNAVSSRPPSRRTSGAGAVVGTGALAGLEGESSVDSTDSRLRMRSASGSGNTISSAAKRLSKLLGKAHLFSPSSGEGVGSSRQALNGLATELVRRAAVPVLVVNEDVLDFYK
ncbi:hypothetical protein CF319_g5805 [Tilletia indica]|nr:hypothetical protein CF319_g5805 [Tilletia indica]